MKLRLDNDAIIDWGLTLLAVVVAALLLADGGGPDRGQETSVGAVRELELQAQLVKYPTLGEQLGVEGRELLNEVLDTMVSSDTTSPSQLVVAGTVACLLYTSPSPRDKRQSRMPSSA